MRGDARILVIGPSTLGSEVAQLWPHARSVTAEALLNGVWTAGQQEFDGVVVSLAAGRSTVRAIRSLREIAPEARIIVTCPAAEEPRAREAVTAGADDYILEPMQPEDLAAALEMAAPGRFAPADNALPPIQEIVELADVLKDLDAGLQTTLERLAAMLRRAFGAEGVTIQVDDCIAGDGHPDPAVLQEPLRLGEKLVGGVALARREHATYSTADAARLGDYARLIETIVVQTRRQAHWQELAWRDDLSGLRNRRYFDATMDKLLERAVAQRQRLTVVLFDIDDFKTYNDRYGHETGDALIREVAALLRRCSREHDVVARYGGDEFAVIFWDAEQPRVPGSQHPTDPMAVAERFRAVIGEHAFKCLGSGAPGPVTISGGLACFPWDGKTRGELLRAADEALLGAKRGGKNHIALTEAASAQRNTAEERQA